MALAVDEECGGPVHSAPHPAHEVLAYAGRVRVRLELARDPIGIEPETGRMSDEIPGPEGVLVLEEPVVHLPELPLHAGRFGGLGRVRRVRMHFAEREISV